MKRSGGKVLERSALGLFPGPSFLFLLLFSQVPGEAPGKPLAVWADFVPVPMEKEGKAGKKEKSSLPRLLVRALGEVRKRLAGLSGPKAETHILGRAIRVEIPGGIGEDIRKVVRSLWAREPLEFRIVLDGRGEGLDPEAEKARLRAWIRAPGNRKRLEKDPFFIDSFNALPAAKGGPAAGGRIRWVPFRKEGKGPFPPSCVVLTKKSGNEKRGEIWAFLPLRMDLRGLPRIFHQGPAANPDKPAIPGVLGPRLLDVLSNTPPGLGPAGARTDGPLRVFATDPDEESGLRERTWRSPPFGSSPIFMGNRP